MPATMSSHGYDSGKASPGKLRRLKELLLKDDNRTCADCGAPEPKWASANIGVFICLKCCGVHRSLGTHISKVLSVSLDDWTDDQIDSMIEVGGNSSANAIYEASIPAGFSKPGPDSGYEERSHFIRSKYELQEFLKPSLRIISFSAQRNSSVQSYDSRTSQKMRVKTKVIKSNLNPVWDEELMLSVPESYGALKLQVFDHDTFSADDIMGEAEIDIQPLVTAAMAHEDVGFVEDMQIGKWLASSDNALLKDSIIRIVDGSVKQEVSLKLQNVESGEIELELEWMPLDQ
ncbi:ADP-ribosylation factor GTPase-activating protein AGD12 isoform X2 [Amborella trichopoda]|uniref:ADP-ribosylation factor GTPase-activating protein AGD12 isoform X2 n=1 Tax=Amborella trichopoda TaxID=13333 RepID=UPI0009C14E4E|nr:ADP-ribosylation factor GTPase-activating protein AGD12 isoform X2 [Amborella trichopoda]|eukprot:XP_020523914.1 ADP-ribosylation factor GTPase-activating protein AGD12 isoform X2 [Amborella trichopoda]